MAVRLWKRNIREKINSISKKESLPLYLLIITFLLFTIHYFVFWGYISDDAGITFASAKTLVDYGRFSIDQFAERVEAHSNPLWMIILACIYFIGIPIPLGAKILSYFLGIATICMVYLISSKYGIKPSGLKPWTNIIGPLLLAVMTGFVLWGAAGLENELYAFLTAGLIYGCLKFEEASDIILIALFSFLIAITRPEGLLFAIALYIALFGRLSKEKTRYRKLFIPILTTLCLYCSSLIARYHIFSWIYPNTYYAKIGNSHVANAFSGIVYAFGFISKYWLLLLFNIILLFLLLKGGFFKSEKNLLSTKYLSKIRFAIPLFILLLITIFFVSDFYYISEFYPSSLKTYISLLTAHFILALICIGLTYIFARSRHETNYLNKLVNGSGAFSRNLMANKVIWYSIFIILANIIYILYVGGTWGTTRFLTPTLVSLALISTELFKDAYASSWNDIKIRKIALDSKKIVALIMILFILQMAYNTGVAYKNPIVRFGGVKEGHADWGNEVGGYLIANQYLPNAKHIPYMVPDIGATAYFANNYTIIDSARLGNVPIAHNGYEPDFFKDYVFNITKPVIIETHQAWSYVTNIGLYNEFTHRYELVKGCGTVQYLGKTLPRGYYIRTDLFISSVNVPLNNSNEYLVLKDYNISSSLFSQNGEMNLNTYWQKSITAIPPKTIDNHTMKIFLKNPKNEYLIDKHQITGGYYLPSKWNQSSVILDKRTIPIKNVTEGNYTPIIRVSYPGGQIDTNILADIKIASKHQRSLNHFISEFYDGVTKNDSTKAEIALKKIKGLDLLTYQIYHQIYIENKLKYINTLIKEGQPFEAYQAVYPLVGSKIGDEKLNDYLRKTEIKLSGLFEQKGKSIENERKICDAIDLYEKSIWLNPDNSKLRRHIEDIKQN
ncbi:MAG: hypothetical protein WBE22_07535 [Halobacteriota archaeon]